MIRHGSYICLFHCSITAVVDNQNSPHLTGNCVKREMLRTIHQLHTDKLLPDILISISECFNQAKIDSKHFPSTISKERRIILSIIYKAFVNFSNEIKCDDQLTLAFESILETLIELNYENAAVILDEFRLH